LDEIVEDQMTAIVELDLVIEEILLPPVMKEEEEAHGESNHGLRSKS
jgi:hypothetical protein